MDALDWQAWAEDGRAAWLDVPLDAAEDAVSPEKASTRRALVVGTIAVTLGDLLSVPPLTDADARHRRRWLERLLPVLPRLASVAPPPSLAAASSEAGVVRWAVAKGVRDLVAMRASDVGSLPGMRSYYLGYGSYSISVAAWLASEERTSGAGDALVEVIERVAAERRAALASEREAEIWRAQEPDDPRLAPSWRGVRKVYLEHRASMFAAPARQPQKYTFVGDPPSIELRPLKSKARNGWRVDLTQWPGLSIGLGVGRVDREGVVSAWGAVLDLFTRPELAPQRAELLAVVGMAPWEREVEMLRQILSPAAVSEGELGWAISDATSDLPELLPVLVKPKRGGQTVRVVDPKDIGVERVADGRDELLLDMLHRRMRPWSVKSAMLRELVGHPRLFSHVFRTYDPITLTEGALTVALEPAGDGFGWVARLDGEDVTDALTDAAEVLIDVYDGWWLYRQAPASWRLVRTSRRTLELFAKLQSRENHLPVAALPAVVAAMETGRHVMPLQLSESLAGETVVGDDRPLLRMHGEPGALSIAAFVCPLEDQQPLPPGEGPALLHTLRAGRIAHVRRDLTAEAARVRDELEGIGLAASAMFAPWRWEIRDTSAALALLAAIAERGPALRVAWAGPPVKIGRIVRASDLRVSVGSGTDWFKLDASALVDGQHVDLAALREAVIEGRGWTRLSDGSWVRLERTVRELLGGVARAGEGRVGLLQAPVVQALAEAGAKVEQHASFSAVVDKIAAAQAYDAPLPADLQAVLRPYQEGGFRWLASLAMWAPGAVLADDMGLGKTLQAIALLLHRRELGPAIVVAPTSVVDNWAAELRRFAPALTPVVHRGADRQDRGADLAPTDVLITSFDVLIRDVESLSKRRFGTLVVDEAQAIKNPGTLRAKAVRAMGADFRLALSGTPVENRVLDLWAILSGAGVEVLGDLSGFRERFADAVEVQRDADARSGLARLVRPFVLRRRKRDVELQLPSRTEMVERIELSIEERVLYEKERLDAVTRLEDAAASEAGGRFAILAALMRLRQLACHPRLVDGSSVVRSSKLERLRQLVGELKEEGHRALIFSQFTTHLGLVREALTEDGVTMRYLDGATPADQRAREISSFQAGEADVFLLSLKAGGTGLNLTAATYVIHLDPWWNPAAEDQATDRAHRIGQDRAVTVVRLVTVGTIEEKILAMHGEKRELASAVLEGTDAAHRVSPAELLGLLKDGDDEPADALAAARETVSAPTPTAARAAVFAPTPTVSGELAAAPPPGASKAPRKGTRQKGAEVAPIAAPPTPAALAAPAAASAPAAPAADPAPAAPAADPAPAAPAAVSVSAAPPELASPPAPTRAVQPDAPTVGEVIDRWFEGSLLANTSRLAYRRALLIALGDQAHTVRSPDALIEHVGAWIAANPELPRSTLNCARAAAKGVAEVWAGAVG